MGHKVNPIGFRLGVTSQWRSRWYAGGNDYRDNLIKDLEIRDFIKKRLSHASVSQVHIERPARSARITISTARPGIVIGKKGEDIDRLRSEVAKRIGLPAEGVHISVDEIRKPELDAQLVAENVAQQLERRIMFRRAMKRAVGNAMRLGAGGVRINVSGRLNGAEIARREWYRDGRVPLHTLRAEIDYGFAQAKTTYGVLGVKIWIFKGEVFDPTGEQIPADETAAAMGAG